MKQRLALTFLALFMTSSLSIAGQMQASQTANQPAKPKSQVTSAPMSPAETPLTETSASKVLLEYQWFLRSEAQRNSEELDRFLDRTERLIGWTVGALTVIGGALAFVVTYFGRRTYLEWQREVRTTLTKRAKEHFDSLETDAKQQLDVLAQQFQRTSTDILETRLSALENILKKRQHKYSSLLESYFLRLFETDEKLRNQWLGACLPAIENLRKKHILWVDDDGVGISLFVSILKAHCGLQVTLRESTREALGESLSNYDLVISNLRREPDDNAGILLTEAIRNQKQSRIPIIIFTKPSHGQLYGSEIEALNAHVAVNQDDLMSKIAAALSGQQDGRK